MELTLGARFFGKGETSFRVWAPNRKRIDLQLTSNGLVRTVPMRAAKEGYFETEAAAPAGSLYKYQLDGGEAFPDPCSRYQPEGPHGPSQVLDPSTFRWTDHDWPGVAAKGQVIYELHLGTFTTEGTYRSAGAKLPYLKELGVTAVELMPVNTFAGRFNWGYDGVSLFAPCAVYGSPDELRQFIDEAHRVGLGVILDVVYNHLGPDGNYLGQYAHEYFSDRYPGEWGDPLNFDGASSAQVRRFFIENACHWIVEYHFDGLRLDATQNLYDQSDKHIVSDIISAARSSAPRKNLYFVAENEPQDVRLILPVDQNGHGADAIWVDDFHHSTRVSSTSQAEAYLSDYRGDSRELLAAVRHNSIYQGQWYAWQKKPRGSPLLGQDPDKVVFFLQNHDQVSNHARGLRQQNLTGEPRARSLTTLLLLAPQTPLLFMGQEFFASSPFLFFADHTDDLARKVKQGRQAFLSQFPEAKRAFEQEGYQLPWGEEAFRLSRLCWDDLARNRHIFAMHQELLRLRREDPVFSGATRASFDGAVLGERCLLFRFFGSTLEGDRLLIVNIGPRLQYSPCSEPLLAPPIGQQWALLFSSEDAAFGGSGATYSTGVGPWTVQGEAATLLRSRKVQ